jgi:site-specific recombinase XerD
MAASEGKMNSEDSKRTEQRAEPRCAPGVSAGGANFSAQPVTLGEALAVFFEQDLHPTTGVSPHTVASYKTTFRLLVRFLNHNHPDLLSLKAPVERLDATLVEAFLRHLALERGCCAATVNVRRAAFGALARALQRRYPQLASYCQSILAIRQRKTAQTLVGYFEVHELEAIFATVDNTCQDGFRDLVMLRCLYNTGARASELCGLRLQDLRLDEPAHVVLNGKGGKIRTVPLWPVTADLLRAYLKAARRTPKAGHEDFVFIGRRRNALTRQGLYNIARRYIEAAARSLPRLERSELHPVCSFRHTTATHLLMAGVTLPVIQEILGHARLETTTRYRAVSLERKHQALQRLLELRTQKSQTAHKPLPQWADSQEVIDFLERL